MIILMRWPSLILSISKQIGGYFVIEEDRVGIGTDYIRHK